MEDREVWVRSEIQKVVRQQGQVPTFNEAYRGSFEESASYYYK
jgi:hypothetical protein